VWRGHFCERYPPSVPFTSVLSPLLWPFRPVSKKVRMDAVFTEALAIITNPLVLLFALFALGYGVDRLFNGNGRLLPIAILVIAPIMAVFTGFELPEEVRSLGIVMFVYVIGLETGREFFPTFRQHWVRFGIIGFLASAIAALLVWAGGSFLGWNGASMVAFYAGALTNAPAFEWMAAV
jgi:putative transport protein